MSERVGARRMGSAVIRRRWLVLALALCGGIFGVLTSQLLPRSYTISTSVLVGAPLEDADIQHDELGASEALARTYADVILQEPVLRGTVEHLDLGTTWQELKSQVRAEVARDNQRLITVVVQAPTPDEGVEIAAEIPRQLALLVGGDTGPDPRQGPGSNAFLEGRRHSIRAHIDRARRSLQVLHRDADTSPDVFGRSRSRSNELRRLIIDWYGDYVSFSRSMDADVPIDRLEVYEPPSVSPESARPQAWAHIAQAVLIALLLALVVVYLREFG